MLLVEGVKLSTVTLLWYNEDQTLHERVSLASYTTLLIPNRHYILVCFCLLTLLFACCE